MVHHPNAMPHARRLVLLVDILFHRLEQGDMRRELLLLRAPGPLDFHRLLGCWIYASSRKIRFVRMTPFQDRAWKRRGPAGLFCYVPSH